MWFRADLPKTAAAETGAAAFGGQTPSLGGSKIREGRTIRREFPGSVAQTRVVVLETLRVSNDVRRHTDPQEGLSSILGLEPSRFLPKISPSPLKAPAPQQRVLQDAGSEAEAAAKPPYRHSRRTFDRSGCATVPRRTFFHPVMTPGSSKCC